MSDSHSAVLLLSMVAGVEREVVRANVSLLATHGLQLRGNSCGNGLLPSVDQFFSLVFLSLSLSISLSLSLSLSLFLPPSLPLSLPPSSSLSLSLVKFVDYFRTPEKVDNFCTCTCRMDKTTEH